MLEGLLHENLAGQPQCAETVEIQVTTNLPDELKGELQYMERHVDRRTEYWNMGSIDLRRSKGAVSPDRQFRGAIMRSTSVVKAMRL